MTQAGTLEDLQEVGAYLQGHFLLTTGRHSDTFFLLARLTEWPQRLIPWIEILRERLGDISARTVVGPAVGGIIPAYQLASTMGNARVLFAEKDTDGSMQFRRGFHLEPGEPVVIVEDAITTGFSVGKVMEAVERQGGRVVAVGTLVNRSQVPLPWDVPVASVLQLTGVRNWAPDECPLCQQGLPLTAPKR
ncbi:orotate phosphoribosyltransferase [Sulfobacillus sp. hq2]|uniref:orotate phosphoribosyltransferase n=1 Tax=Sulfobacillus TaxID=28033 RepID=UPI000CD093F8|nr:orotate phosphoribosyltransferase [Sulfobacillus sp. hq2]POB09299.1 orotate phosphoribosyltransferase [Sulfobacillus sp. hq2]